MGCRKWINDPRTIRQRHSSMTECSLPSLSLLQKDTDRVRDISSSSTARARQPTHGPCITRSNQLDAQACSIFGRKLSVFDYPRGYPTYIRQHSSTFPTPTPEDALPSARWVETVTPITCHQSRITGESTCPMDACIPTGKQIDPLMLLTTSVTWLTFREPGSRNIAR